MKNAKLTTKEMMTVKSLISLGDSEKLAKETVISNRGSEAMKVEAREFYRFAYEG